MLMSYILLETILYTSIFSPLTRRYESVGIFRAFSLSGYVIFLNFGINFVALCGTLSIDSNLMATRQNLEYAKFTMFRKHKKKNGFITN